MFTARYEQNPYITHIRFVCKRLKSVFYEMLQRGCLKRPFLNFLFAFKEIFFITGTTVNF